jgi:hypothetical protein
VISGASQIRRHLLVDLDRAAQQPILHAVHI